MKKIEDDQFLDLMTLKTKFSLVNCLFVLKSFYSTAGGAANQGALGPFGLLVLADESLSEQTPIYFYVAKGAEGKLKTFFCAHTHTHIQTISIKCLSCKITSPLEEHCANLLVACSAQTLWCRNSGIQLQENERPLKKEEKN
ncbi:unnamed protein product [Camellia sinensis]